jgi:hypothetical protein
VSEQQADQTSGAIGSMGAGPAVPPSSSDATSDQVTASAPEISLVEAPGIAPGHEAACAEGSKDEVTKIEVTKIEAMKVEIPKVEISQVEFPSLPELEANPDTPRMAGQSRFGAIAAMVALATVAGALGGALATSGIGHLIGAADTSSAYSTLEASIARLDAEIVAFKADVEHTSKLVMSQFNKTSDRLDKLEKAVTEPAAKLAKLGEAVDKLRAAPAAKDVTGSVAPPQTATSAAATPAPAAAAPKVEVARLPTVEGWVLTDVGYGGALIENRRSSYEVYAGDTVPGLGRIDAIRRQDGHWVVVTSKGLIVAR